MQTTMERMAPNAASPAFGDGTRANRLKTTKQGGKLVSASSPIATSVEVHEMKMDGDMMRMRPVEALPLPAGKPVELKAGAFHMMLMGLKAPVKAGDVVPIKLVVEDAKGRRETVDVSAIARLY